jgi:hypothetical protein
MEKEFYSSLGVEIDFLKVSKPSDVMIGFGYSQAGVWASITVHLEDTQSCFFPCSVSIYGDNFACVFALFFRFYYFMRLS